MKTKIGLVIRTTNSTHQEFELCELSELSLENISR